MPPPLSNTHLRTPFGFNELLTYLTREILRSQPENIYEFCLTTCQQLINERDNGILSDELVKLNAVLLHSTVNSREIEEKNERNNIGVIKEGIEASKQLNGEPSGSTFNIQNNIIDSSSDIPH